MPTKALIARGDSPRISSWKEKGGKWLRQIAPQVEVRWFDTPHDIPIFVPAEVAEVIEAAAERTSEPAGSEAAAGQ